MKRPEAGGQPSASRPGRRGVYRGFGGVHAACLPACLPAGWDHRVQEDRACGDSCPRSSPLADRQAGLGQKLYVLKLFLNQKPQDSTDFVVVV